MFYEKPPRPRYGYGPSIQPPRNDGEQILQTAMGGGTRDREVRAEGFPAHAFSSHQQKGDVVRFQQAEAVVLRHPPLRHRAQIGYDVVEIVKNSRPGHGARVSPATLRTTPIIAGNLDLVFRCISAGGQTVIRGQACDTA